ncbi:hypothetical protein ACQKCU_17680 [Heyndrickxia sporothermodurans]
MNLERAKRILNEMEQYIQFTESYITRDFDTLIIKEYAVVGGIRLIVEKLNDLGYGIGETKKSEENNP